MNKQLQKNKTMNFNKSFILLLRLFIVLFSIQFLKDFFYQWDGYSHYMSFIEFLPDLSLSFIVWTISGAIAIFILWSLAYGFYKFTHKLIAAFRVIDLLFIIEFLVISLFIQRTFFSHIAILTLIRSHYIAICAIGVIIICGYMWLIRKYVESILYGIDTRISPLSWIVISLFIIALPLSTLNFNVAVITSSTATNTSDITKDQKADSTEFSTSLTRKESPNIIMVVMDALSTFDMQVYEYERPTTPFIQEWAKNAIVFDKLYASSNWTTPTVMSLMTGQRPWTHRIWYQAKFHPVKKYDYNLPKILSDQGYDIYGFVQNDYAHPATLGMKDSFSVKDASHNFSVPSKWWFFKLRDFFSERPIAQRWLFSNNQIAGIILSFMPDIEITTTPSELVYNKFIEFISQKNIQKTPNNITKPFFAYLHVFPPHDPYLPPKPYVGHFGDTDRFNTHNKQKKLASIHSEYDLDKQADIDILRKRYDEYILYSDKQFELLLSRLNESIDMSNTIIVLTSDHGQSFTNGFLGHNGPHLYESMIRVPLIIKLPEETQGKTIHMPIEQIDIAPTILDLNHIPAPDWIEGRSLLPLIKGNKIEARPIFSMQLDKNKVFEKSITKGTIAILDGNFKLVYYLDTKNTLLFNIYADPEETHNIAEEKPEISHRLLAIIQKELEKDRNFK